MKNSLFFKTEKENIHPKHGSAPSFPKDFTYESFLYYRKEVKCLTVEGWTAYYRCNNRKEDCKATLILRPIVIISGN